MILKASQRGGAKQLGLHLTNSLDNDHVELHEIRGFVSGSVIEALKEAYAVSQGTRCRQFLFSVSLSPPPQEDVDVSSFEDAIARIEKANNLIGHPRIVVFHEKYGRRHAHVVWSRIDAKTMTARNLPHFKLKLRDLSRSLFLENDWQLPEGLMNSEKRDPRNFTLAEWQQAKRNGNHAGDLKEIIQECWAASDDRQSFANALKDRGFILAKGDRRGHVAVFHTGQVFAISRTTGKRVKEIQAKLDETDQLPSVGDAKNQFKQDTVQSFKRLEQNAKARYQVELGELKGQQQDTRKHHRAERELLDTGQKQRWEQEAKIRNTRYRKGLLGFWDRLTGAHTQIRAQIEQEAMKALARDRQQRQELIRAQLNEMHELQNRRRVIAREALGLIGEIREERNSLIALLEEPERPPKRIRQRSQDRNRKQGPEIDLE